MSSVAPTAAEQPPIFHAEAERSPLEAAVASELAEGLAASGFLVLPSQMEGFVQVGAPVEGHEVVNFGTSKKKCPTTVAVRTVPGKLVAEDAAPAVCPVCGGTYTYGYHIYAHLGGFRCPKCGYARPTPQYAVTEITAQDVDSSSVNMDLNGRDLFLHINLPAVYNIYNAAGAAAALDAFGFQRAEIAGALASFDCGFGRMEKFDLEGTPGRMMLVKNPAGCNQVLEFLQNIKEKFILVVCLNDRPADGTDVSWIWDADFEALAGMAGRLEQVIVSGDRAQDMRVRIKYAGIPDGQIQVERDYARLVEQIAGQELPVFLMPTYTAMLELRQVVIRHCGGTEFWK